MRTSLPPSKRPWLATHEVRAMLGISQQRVSQLVKDGTLTAVKDDERRIRYDREEVEQLARDRASRKASRDAEADERKARKAEAQYRLERARRQEAQAKAEAERRELEWRERILTALEKIARNISA